MDWYKNRSLILKILIISLFVLSFVIGSFVLLRVFVYYRTTDLPLETFTSDNSTMLIKIRSLKTIADDFNTKLSGYIPEETRLKQAVNSTLKSFGIGSIDQMQKDLKRLDPNTIYRFFGREILIDMTPTGNVGDDKKGLRSVFVAISKLSLGDTILSPLLQIAAPLLGIKSTKYKDKSLSYVRMSGTDFYFATDGSRIIISNDPDSLLRATEPKLYRGVYLNRNERIQAFIKYSSLKTGPFSGVYTLIKYTKDLLTPDYCDQDSRHLTLGLEPGNIFRLHMEHSLNTMIKSVPNSGLADIIKKLPAQTFYVQGVHTNVNKVWDWLKKNYRYLIDDPDFREEVGLYMKLMDGEACNLPKNFFHYLDSGFVVIASNEIGTRYSHVGSFASLTTICKVKDSTKVFGILDREIKTLVVNAGFKRAPDIKSLNHNGAEIKYIYQEEFHSVMGLKDIFVPCYAKYEDYILASLNLNHLIGILDLLTGKGGQSLTQNYFYKSIEDEEILKTSFAPIPPDSPSFGFIDFEGLHRGGSDYIILYVNEYFDPVEIRKEVFEEQKKKDPGIIDINDQRLNLLVVDKMEQKKQQLQEQLNNYLSFCKLFDWVWFGSKVEKGKTTTDIFLKLR
ncbi:MAG: hypothetical protein HY606_09145 [Planctomycetes bacterium]|nr:hypothetical protein [Planctomycetota bacterium]